MYNLVTFHNPIWQIWTLRLKVKSFARHHTTGQLEKWNLNLTLITKVFFLPCSPILSPRFIILKSENVSFSGLKSLQSFLSCHMATDVLYNLFPIYPMLSPHLLSCHLPTYGVLQYPEHFLPFRLKLHITSYIKSIYPLEVIPISSLLALYCVHTYSPVLITLYFVVFVSL